MISLGSNSFGNFFGVYPFAKIGLALMLIPAFGTAILTELYKLYRDRYRSKRVGKKIKRRNVTQTDNKSK